MKIQRLLLLLALSSQAFAQVASEDFSVANTDNWGVEHHTSGIWMATGGNPAGMLQITISNSQSILPAAMIVPDAPNHPWSGDFASMDVASLSYDREVVSGVANFGTRINLVLGNDNGTPTNFGDDTLVFIETGDVFQFGSLPWTTFSTVIPSQSTLLPAGWSAEAFPGSPVAGSGQDTLWDHVIHEVDYVGLAMGRPLNGGAWFGSHTLNFDNFILDGQPFTGVTFCDPANFNSTGLSTSLVGSFLTGGGIGGGMSDLHLECADGVPNQLGYFLVGVSANDPGAAVSNGVFCLGSGPFFRYNLASTTGDSVGLFNASGVLVNFAGTSSVGPMGMETGFDVPEAIVGSTQVITAGSTWHFQVWHRDTPAGVGTSNFSNGLSVTF
ncbi:MAG: hypothetical protein ACI87O_003151 [Planctomycetota bacterium]|jgi:hypothetical protein